MRETASGSYELGYFDQLPGVCTYTVITLGFSLRADERPAVDDQLRKATDAIVEAFPWLEGTVILTVPEDEREKSSGTYSVTTEARHDVLVFKDLDTVLPSYESITAAGAPICDLPGDKLSDVKGLPKSYNPPEEDCPVLLIQASHLTGGLLLTFATHHNVSDMNGQGQIIRLFSQAMRGEPFDADHLKWGNIDRRSVIPLLKDDEEAPEIKHLRGEGKIGKDPWAGSEPVDAPWKVIRFSAVGLKDLKEQASLKLAGQSTINHRSPSATEWISTNDALTAFILQSVVRARAVRLSAAEDIHFCRSIDGRKRLQPQLPESYIGHFASTTFNAYPLEYVKDPTNFSAVTASLRASVLAFGDLHFRALTALLGSLKDRTVVDYGAALKFPRDLIVSSWAGLGLANQEFGLLGRPEWSRRPDFGSFESCMYVCEKSLEGDYYAQASLRPEDWNRLEGDEMFTKYARIIG